MRKLIIGSLALVGVAIAAPANAQSVYFGVGGGPYYSGGYSDGYYDTYRHRHRHYSAPRYVYRDSYAQEYRHCRIVKVWRGDHWRRIRRCYQCYSQRNCMQSEYGYAVVNNRRVTVEHSTRKVIKVVE